MIYENTKQILIYIKQQLIEKDMTIKDLSIQLNKSQSATGQLLRQNNITLESLNDICIAMNYKLEINIIPNDSKDF